MLNDFGKSVLKNLNKDMSWSEFKNVGQATTDFIVNSDMCCFYTMDELICTYHWVKFSFIKKNITLYCSFPV